MVSTVLVDGGYGAIIEVIPSVIDRILGVGRVVAEAHAAKVIRDPEAVVDQVLRVLLIRHQNEWPHIQPGQWELNKCVDFLPTSEAILIAACLESLEADNHDARHSVDFQRLRRLHMLLALIAVPFIVLIQRL